MKIQLASDLHLELLEHFPDELLITPAPDADVLVLAGDIADSTMCLYAFDSWPVPIVYVAGNHEFYGVDWNGTRADMRREAAKANVHFLDNDAVVIGSVRFLGCTLWTDFRVADATQDSAMETVERALNDYRRIRTPDGALTAKDTLRDHEASRAWLERELQKPFAGHTVVVTHHGPHPLSIHPRYAGDTVNAGFVSELSELLPQTKLWLHGHVHDSFDYVVDGCRVVANPAGYVRNRWSVDTAADFVFENSRFDPSLVIDLERDLP